MAVSDDRVALVFRHLEEMSTDDALALANFGAAQGFDIWLQPGGPDTAYPLADTTPALLSYQAGGCRIQFAPLDFTQVNADINRLMIDRVLELIEAGPSDRVLDLFCGVGNFTLPLARAAGRVFGIEGELALADRANANAAANGLANVECVKGDLNDPAAALPADAVSFNKVLLDPPRTGAQALLEHFDFSAVERAVYVSCNPATLARDAGLMCGRHGFRLAAAGIMDMFPHTAHVESIAVFDRS
ncbi:MAG: methyltransferase domain-containing protein [Gammaproteobacteria bacterium]|nr:methyltransferase domain-containing protein [Gammaproteobacteria bacterium]